MDEIRFQDEETGIILVAAVRQEFDDGQPRVRDLDLGEWLGYADPVSIRLAIRRNKAEVEALGIVFSLKTIPEGAGRPGEEFWLTEDQAIAVCQLSQTARAGHVRTMLRRMFVEYRKGSLVAV